MKKLLLTTTALAAMSGAAMAGPGTVGWGGTAYVNYKADGDASVFDSDASLTATMNLSGNYTAAVGIGVGEAVNAPTATVTVKTPQGITLIVDETGDMNEASTTYSKVAGMTGVGTTENAAIQTSIAMDLGTFAASYTSDLNLDSDNSSFGASGSMGDLSFTFGSKNEDMGMSISGTAFGDTTLKVAFEEVGTNSNSGVSVGVALTDTATLTLNADDTSGVDGWSASVKTTVSDATVTVGTDDAGDTTVDVSAPLVGGAKLIADYTTDGAVGSEYAIEMPLNGDGGGAKLIISHSDRAAADTYDLGTNLKLSFTF